MFKISGWVWVVVGIFLGLTVISYGLFQHYLPDKEEAELLNTYESQLQTEANKLAATQRRIDNSVARVEETAKQLNEVIDAKIVDENVFIDLTVEPHQLVVNAPSYRDKVQRAVNTQVRRGGVTVVQGPLVPFPAGEPNVQQSFFNYSRLPFPVVVFELGTVTVRGSFDQISANVKAWADMPNYFAVASGLAITGTSPALTGTYNVVIVGFIPGQVGSGLSVDSAAAPAEDTGAASTPAFGSGN